MYYYVYNLQYINNGDQLYLLQDAMITILADLRHEDQFNILLFESHFHLWKTNSMIQATKTAVREAQNMIRNIRAGGG